MKPQRREHVIASFRAAVTAVCEVYRLREDDVRGRRRVAVIAEARKVAYYVLREFGRLSFYELRDVFERDHATILAGVQRIQAVLRIDAALRQRIDRVLLLAELMPQVCDEFVGVYCQERPADFLPRERDALDICARNGCMARRFEHERRLGVTAQAA